MSKAFTEIELDAALLGGELDRLRDLLDSAESLGERDVQDLFKSAPHLTAFMGAAINRFGMADGIAYEFEILGDYRADAAIVGRHRNCCLVEFEQDSPDAVFRRVGKKATRDWARAFERGFSQIVDWFQQLDDLEKTDRFRRYFGPGPIDFTGLLLVGRDAGLTDDELRRLQWRSRHVVVDSHPVVCLTYDQLHRELREALRLQSRAFRVEPPPAPGS